MKKPISIFEVAASAPFDPGIARRVKWAIWEAAWLAANMEESTGQDGDPFYRLPESDNRDYWQARWAAPFALDAEKSAHGKTIDELKAEQFALKSARGRIDQLLDANLKLQANLAKIDNIQKTADAAREGAREGARAEIQRTLPKVYGKAMNAEPGQDPFKPKPRRKGGGRKKSKDIGDKQVLAVLAAMKEKQLASRRAYSVYVIRKGGDFSNPYEDQKGLDAAVVRYAKRKRIKLTFKTSRTGKWGSTK